MRAGCRGPITLRDEAGAAFDAEGCPTESAWAPGDDLSGFFCSDNPAVPLITRNIPALRGQYVALFRQVCARRGPSPPSSAAQCTSTGPAPILTKPRRRERDPSTAVPRRPRAPPQVLHKPYLKGGCALAGAVDALVGPRGVLTAALRRDVAHWQAEVQCCEGWDLDAEVWPAPPRPAPPCGVG